MADHQNVTTDTTTKRLTFRQFSLDDLDDLVELDNDGTVMMFINNGAPVERSTVADMLAAWIGEYGESEHFGCWAAVDREQAEFVGWFHLRSATNTTDSVPELGYRLHHRFWGLGLATEGSRALIRHAFTHTRCRRVRAETMAVHEASRRVMERCGMHLVRTFDANWPVDIPGSEYGDVEYAIDRSEWTTGRTLPEVASTRDGTGPAPRGSSSS